MPDPAEFARFLEAIVRAADEEVHHLVLTADRGSLRPRLTLKGYGASENLGALRPYLARAARVWVARVSRRPRTRDVVDFWAWRCRVVESTITPAVVISQLECAAAHALAGVVRIQAAFRRWAARGGGRAGRLTAAAHAADAAPDS
jgi:hypothetical protein